MSGRESLSVTYPDFVAAASGDERALSTLVQLYHDRVYRYGVRVCRDRFDADDAVQEAFIRLSARPDVASQPGALRWLLTVVLNACRRMMRPFSRERSVLGERMEADEARSSDVTPEMALERWELVRTVHAAIAELDKPYREVLVLRDLEGLSGEATCKILELDLAAMKSRLHRARAMLRDKITRLQTKEFH